MNELDKQENQYRDLLDKHNFLSRFAGFMIVIVFVATFSVGIFTNKVIQQELIIYSSISIIVVFGGVSLISNNIGKILDIIKSFRSK